MIKKFSTSQLGDNYRIKLKFSLILKKEIMYAQCFQLKYMFLKYNYVDGSLILNLINEKLKTEISFFSFKKINFSYFEIT